MLFRKASSNVYISFTRAFWHSNSYVPFCKPFKVTSNCCVLLTFCVFLCWLNKQTITHANCIQQQQHHISMCPSMNYFEFLYIYCLIGTFFYFDQHVLLPPFKLVMKSRSDYLLGNHIPFVLPSLYYKQFG